MSEGDFKKVIDYTVSKIISEQELPISVNVDVRATIGDVVFNQLRTIIKDVEYFSKHAKRSVVSMEDIKLCARRNQKMVF